MDYEREIRKRLDSIPVDVSKTDMHFKQAALVNSLAKRRIAKAGRRGGKTEAASIIACMGFKAGRRVLYAVPVGDQLQRFWSVTTRAFARAVDQGLVYKNETEHIIELPGTDVRIKAKTAWNADTLRGDFADILLIDEWQLMNEDAWEFVGAPMLVDNNGDAVFLFTQRLPEFQSRTRRVTTKAKDPLHAVKMLETAKADRTGRWAAFEWTSHENPHISKEGLESVIRDMSSLAYRIEIMGEDIRDAPGALWKRDEIDRHRVVKAPPLSRIVVGVDPSATSTGDEAGIITAGSEDEEGYILSDDSVQGSPLAWGKAAVTAYHKFSADRVIAECVPLNSEILTRNGWRLSNQVQIGDEVLGYDISADICRWTKVTGINFDCAEVVTYEHDNFKVRCTRNHKWAMIVESRAGKAKYGKKLPYSKKTRGLFTIDEMRTNWRRGNIVQVARAEDGPGMIIENHTDWINRSGAVIQVLTMTSTERRGFIYGMLLGEGSLVRRSNAIQFSQNPGAVNDAFRLCCFLEGIANGGIQINRKNWKGEEHINYRSTILKKRVRTAEKLRETNSVIERVWCPTTEMGTWVMRQNERIMITGNSNNGGEMVELTIKQIDPNVPVKLVHASRGKYTRAEPISALAEKGKIHHVGRFDALENELCMWAPGDASPNRLDACFSAGTMVETENGSIPIEKIKNGDKVLTRGGFKKVLNSGFTGFKKTVDLILSCDTILEVTPNHSIFTIERGFIKSCNLTKSDTLLTLPISKSHLPLKEVQIRRLVPAHVVSRRESSIRPVFNLEVEKFHEYFANGVLVHNCVWALTELMLETTPGFVVIRGRKR